MLKEKEIEKVFDDSHEHTVCLTAPIYKEGFTGHVFFGKIPAKKSPRVYRVYHESYPRPNFREAYNIDYLYTNFPEIVLDKAFSDFTEVHAKVLANMITWFLKQKIEPVITSLTDEEEIYQIPFGVCVLDMESTNSVFFETCSLESKKMLQGDKGYKLLTLVIKAKRMLPLVFDTSQFNKVIK